MSDFSILLVDDEAAVRLALRRALDRLGHQIDDAGDGGDALEMLASKTYDLVLLDLGMPGIDGRETLRRLADLDLESPPQVVVLTAELGFEVAAEALDLGADDYLAKPWDRDELRFVVTKALQRRELELRIGHIGIDYEFEMIGEDPVIVALRRQVAEVAGQARRVLVSGATGSGKELVARALHRHAGRSGPFVAVNCGAIPAELLESELFGHSAGAFTGAKAARRGRLVEASGGTLFLDEIGELPLAAQVALLRVLESERVLPLGTDGPGIEVDLQVVSATHCDLAEMVCEGTFREDLYYRIAVLRFDLPGLKERGDDVLQLAEHFLAGRAGRRLQLAPDAKAALLKHSWPGNVRELANAIERAAIFSRAGIIREVDLPAELRDSRPVDGSRPERVLPGESLTEAKQRVAEAFEAQAIRAAVQECSGNVSEAARQLGIHRQSLQQRMKALEIDSKEFR